MTLSFDSILPLLLAVGVLLLLAACNPFRFGKKRGTLRFVTKETPLNTLPNDAPVLVMMVGNATDRGIYWLDLDHRRVYLAQALPSNVLPEAKAMTWTGTELVYGHRMDGFFALTPDGEHRQVTPFAHTGQIARSGDRILRFKKCGPDETSSSYTITPLDRFTEPPLLCLPRMIAGEDYWYSIHPVWNPSHPQPDFVVSKRSGQGQEKVVESSTLVEVLPEGDLREILELGPDFAFITARLHLLPRPDGQAFFVHQAAANTTRIIDREGNTLVDVGALEVPGMAGQPTGRFSWGPDSQTAVLLYEDCSAGADACTDRLVLATDDFQTLTPITTLPPKLRFNYFIWSPDGSQVGLVTNIHQGRDDPPRIVTVRLADQAVSEYLLPTPFILKYAQWVR